MAFLQADRVYKANGVTVKEYLLTTHNPNDIDMPWKRVKPLLGITIHNTDAIKVNGTTMAEQYTRATVNGNMNTVRVHFYVDDTEAWQGLPLDWLGWHSTDGSGDGNRATIAIEVIGDSAKAEENAARLTAWLLDKYGLDTSAVFTHTYWLNVRDGKGAGLDKDARCTLSHPYKVCPIWIIPHWGVFLNSVESFRVKPSGSVAASAGAKAAAHDSNVWGVCRWCGSKNEAETLAKILGEGFATVSKKG